MESISRISAKNGVKPLEEISQSTKIAITNLDFLEKDRYELLPPRVFVKGFIRAYASELDLNPEETLRQFDKFSKVGEVPNYEGEEHPVFQKERNPLSFIGSPIFTVVLTSLGSDSPVVLVLTVVTRLFSSGRMDTTDNPRWQPSDLRNPLRSLSRNYHQTGNRSTRPVQRSQTGTKVLEIKAVSTSWVRVQTDSGPAVETVMSPGPNWKTFYGESFQVQTANAGGLRFRLDGKELPKMGAENQTLAITIP